MVYLPAHLPPKILLEEHAPRHGLLQRQGTSTSRCLSRWPGECLSKLAVGWYRGACEVSGLGVIGVGTQVSGLEFSVLRVGFRVEFTF